MPRMIVQLKDKNCYEKSCQQAISLTSNGNITVKKLPSINGLSISLPEHDTLLSDWRNNNWVQYMEEDITVRLINDQANSGSINRTELPWGMQRIGANYSYIPQKYLRPKVAVLDTGISPHPSLKISSGVNLTEEGIKDKSGHGTHIAGVIAGFSNIQQRRRGSQFHGVYPRLSLHSIKAFNEDGTANLSTIIEGIEWAIDQKMNILNLSFGLERNHPSLHQAIQKAVAENILLIAASGNNGGLGIDYPARYQDVIAVGSISKENQISSFSQYGNQLNVVAPGEEVISTWINNSFQSISGTSMACAHVTGALSILIALQNNVSRTDVQSILEATSEKLPVSSLYQGYGVISVTNIVNSIRKSN